MSRKNEKNPRSMKNDVYNVSKELKSIAELVDKKLTRACGSTQPFSIVVYTSPRASYVSNCARNDSTKGLRALLEHWEAGNPDIPEHKKN